MLTGFDAMLAAHAKVLGRGAQIVLTVTDSVAAFVTLPWQHALSRKNELDAYARSCFECQGVLLDATSLMQHDFRRFGETGVAYALPRHLIDALATIVARHGMTLSSVLPISAVVYTRYRKPRGAGVSIALLREAQRCSALVFDRSGLIEHAIEPVTVSRVESAQRLLVRIASVHPVGRVDEWTSSVQPDTDVAGAVHAATPQTTYKLISREAWS